MSRLSDLLSSPTSKKIIHILFALMAGYMFLLSLNPLSDNDMWFHISTGKVIWESGELPGEVDPFSFTSPNPLPSVIIKGMRTQWLGQTILFLVFDTFGAKGYAIFRSLMIVLPFILLYIIAVRRGTNALALTLFLGAPLLVICHALYSTFERPQAFSFLLAPVAYYLAISMRNSARPWRVGLVLAAIMAVWSNIHGGYIIGVAMVLTVAAGAAVSLLAKKFNIAARWVHGGAVHPVGFFVMTGVVLASSGLNPGGFWVLNWAQGLAKMFMVNLASTGEAKIRVGVVMQEVQEYRPVWGHFGELYMDWIYATISCYLITLSALALKYIKQRRVDLSEIFSVGTMILFGLAYMRGVAFALVFSAIVGSLALVHIGGRRRLIAVAVSSALVIVLFAGTLAANRSWELNPRISKYWVSTDFPHSSLSFLDKHNVRGRMFNLMGWGGYLIWEGYPERQVFFDGRSITNKIVVEYMQIITAKPGWRQLLGGYNVDMMLIPVLSGDNAVLTPIIFRMAMEGPGQWKLVALLGNEAVFVREAEGTREVIDCCEVPFERMYGHIVSVGQLKLIDSPGHPQTLMSMAFGLFWSGRYAETVGVLDQALMSMPNHPIALQLRAQAINNLQRGGK